MWYVQQAKHYKHKTLTANRIINTYINIYIFKIHPSYCTESRFCFVPFCWFRVCVSLDITPDTSTMRFFDIHLCGYFLVCSPQHSIAHHVCEWCKKFKLRNMYRMFRACNICSAQQTSKLTKTTRTIDNATHVPYNTHTYVAPIQTPFLLTPHTHSHAIHNVNTHIYI